MLRGEASHGYWSVVQYRTGGIYRYCCRALDADLRRCNRRVCTCCIRNSSRYDTRCRTRAKTAAFWKPGRSDPYEHLCLSAGPAKDGCQSWLLSLAASAIIGIGLIGTISTDASAYRAGVYCGGVYRGGVDRGGYYRGVRPGVAVGIGAAAVGAAAVGAAAAGAYAPGYYAPRPVACGYYPYPPCY